MTDQPRHHDARRSQRTPSAYGLLMNYEQALQDAVEATIVEGLRLSRATVAARTRAADAWRDPLTFIAAEEFSHQLAEQAARGDGVSLSPSSLRRALRPYAALVATAACAEMTHEAHEFVAAD